MIRVSKLYKKKVLVLKSFLLTFFVSACSNIQPLILNVDTSSDSKLLMNKEIIILPLGMKTYSTANDDRPVDIIDLAKLSVHIFELTKDNLKNIRVLTKNFPFLKGVDQQNKYFNYFGSDNIFSNDKTSADTNIFYGSLCATNKPSILIAHSLLIKSGQQGYWNPLNGALGANTSSSYYRLAAFDCLTMKRVWLGSVFYREEASLTNMKIPLGKLHRRLLGIQEAGV